MNRLAIDWDDVRARLRRNEDTLRETLSFNPHRMKIIFRQRAVQLRRKPDTKTSIAAQTPALVFRVGEERHAVALSELTEVLPFRGCTLVPGSPPQFLGVINLRGKLQPVLDLARILSGDASAKGGVILILRRHAAWKVDSVEGLRELQADEPGALTLLNVERLLTAAFSQTGGR